jgi:hypothetical protein
LGTEASQSPVLRLHGTLSWLIPSQFLRVGKVLGFVERLSKTRLGPCQ